MPRSSLNLRPIYGRDELTGGELAQRGIAAALAAKARDVESDNTRRRSGQVMTGEATVGSRIGGIANRIRGIFDRDEVPPALPANVTEALAKPPELQHNGRSVGPIPSTVAATPGTHGIAGRLAAFEEQDDHGNTWRVDPNIAADAARALKVGDVRAEMDVKDEYSERNIRRTTDAMSAAGMPATEAEARVRTGTMRYDETFGQQRPQGRRTMQEERELIELRSQRKLLEQKARTPGGLTPEERQRNFELREREVELRERGQDFRENASDESTVIRGTATTASALKPDAMTAAVESSDPAAKANREGGVKKTLAPVKAVTSAAQKRIDERRAKQVTTPPATPTHAAAKAEETRLIGTGLDKTQARAAMKARGWPIK